MCEQNPVLDAEKTEYATLHCHVQKQKFDIR